TRPGCAHHLRLRLPGQPRPAPRDPQRPQVVENWNSANTVIHYGKDGALTGADKEHTETSVLACTCSRERWCTSTLCCCVNTLLLQHVLADPEWADRLTGEDRRALTA